MKRAPQHLTRMTRGESAKRDIRRAKAWAGSLFETLESRLFLSGNVMAVVVHGNLIIRGDAAANTIVLDQTELSAGQVRISGDATDINHITGTVILNGITRGVDIRMGDGADSVTMNDLTLPGAVLIDGQRGANTFTVNSAHVTTSLTIRNSATSTITESTIGKDLTIQNSATITITGATVGRDMTILPVTGREIVALRSLEVQRNTRIVTGRGSDIVTIDNSIFHGAMRLSTGSGADAVQIASHGVPLGEPTRFNGLVSIALGAGDDILQLGVDGQTGNSSVFAGMVRFNGEGGHNAILDFEASSYTGTARFGLVNFQSNTPVPDTTAPTVIFTDPANGALDIPWNAKIAATFSELMDPLTMIAANVTVTEADLFPVDGTVAYLGTTLTFTPTFRLLHPYLPVTVTITTGAKDLAGNPLAAAFVWTFTTNDTFDDVAPTVTTTSPANIQTNVAINKTIAATFSKSMDALTVTTANFKLTGPGSTPVTGTVNYDAPSKIATFTPSSSLAPNTTFTATITGGAAGVTDLVGNLLATNKVWTFTTGTQVAQAPIDLGAAKTFAVMATAAISGGGDHINGDVGLSPGTSQGIPPVQINGTIHINDQAIIKAQADLLAAYNDAVSRTLTSVSLPGNMGGLTFTPGLYTNSTSVLISGAGPGNNVTLDAQGDPNAIFIFKMGSTLTTGTSSQVILTGGAKAGNIFWQVGSSATLNTNSIFMGNILASVTITVDTGSVVLGRLMAGANSDGSVTVNASTVTVPVA